MNSNHHLLDIITTDSSGGGGAADASGRMVSNSSSASFPTPNRHTIIGTNDAKAVKRPAGKKKKKKEVPQGMRMALAERKMREEMKDQ